MPEDTHKHKNKAVGNKQFSWTGAHGKIDGTINISSHALSITLNCNPRANEEGWRTRCFSAMVEERVTEFRVQAEDSGQIHRATQEPKGLLKTKFFVCSVSFQINTKDALENRYFPPEDPIFIISISRGFSTLFTHTDECNIQKNLYECRNAFDSPKV